MQTPGSGERTPAYWIRQRNGLAVGSRVSKDDLADAVADARRCGAWGDHLATTGLVWIEPDPRGPGGFSYYTLTPVWEQQ